MRKPKSAARVKYDLLKGALYHAKNGLDRSFRNCPEIADHCIELKDGRKISGHDVLSWIEVARANSWRFGPAEVRKKYFLEAINQQPRG